MKTFLIYAILFFALPVYGQAQWTDEMGCITCPPDIAPTFVPNEYKPELHLPEAKPYNWKRAGLTFGMGLFSGVAMGFHETAVHRPSSFPASWNRQYWNGQISWTNKYKDGTPASGPAYFGSTTALAWTTDAKHLFGTLHRAGVLGTGIVIGFGEKRPWWHYGADLVAGFAGYSLGFSSIWDYHIYKR